MKNYLLNFEYKISNVRRYLEVCKFEKPNFNRNEYYFDFTALGNSQLCSWQFIHLLSINALLHNLKVPFQSLVTIKT